ncbi:MAG: RluA family pseudouridine synthase [Fimbriimonadaceae bacterium]|nr:RluA family pseudouridine synthase [Fimbriimonadaceae bacterium]
MLFVADSKERLDTFLARMMPHESRTRLAKLVEAGGVLVEGEAAPKPGMMLRAGWSVQCDEVPEPKPHDLTPVEIPLDVVFEDESLIVVNKPRGLVVHPGPSVRGATLVQALLARGGALSTGSASFRPGIVHRLDKETTGLIAVAKADAVHRSLAEQLRAKTAERRYLTAVKGEPAQARFTVEAPIGRDPRRATRMAAVAGGKPAVTHFKVLGRIEKGALLACRLETGRTHQVRVHLSAVGFPVLGDDLYAPPPYGDGPMQLHAGYLSFVHPVTGATMAFYAPPPPDFVQLPVDPREALEAW